MTDFEDERKFFDRGMMDGMTEEREVEWSIKFSLNYRTFRFQTLYVYYYTLVMHEIKPIMHDGNKFNFGIWTIHCFHPMDDIKKEIVSKGVKVA